MRIPIVLILLINSISGEDYDYDLVVFGASASGIVAAVEASRHDKTSMKIAIVAEEKFIGGMVAGGLSATDTGNTKVIGGLANEFFTRVGGKYNMSQPEFKFAPHVASEVFHDMITESKIDLYLDRYLAEDGSGVVKDNSRIASIKTVSPNGTDSFKSKFFIDASYEGTLMAMSRVSYTVGREGVKDFNESYAGYRGPGGLDYHGMDWGVSVSPYWDNGTLLPHVQEAPTSAIGDGDKHVQAYNFRICSTKSKTNKVPWPKPPNYNPENYELLRRTIVALNIHDHKMPTFGKFVGTLSTRDGKYDFNNNGPISTDLIGENMDYPEANRNRRQEIWQRHYEYMAGFLYYISNDPGVPIALRTEAAEYGLCKDEFVETNNWPWQLYVREARRMRSDFVFSQKDVESDIKKDDTIGMGSYPIDSHNSQRFPSNGSVHNEGDMYMHHNSNFQIPYRVLVPKKEEATNLLVSVCVSSTHIGYGPLRLEPQYMIMGQAAGLAAAEANFYNLAVQDISVKDIQGKLRSENAILEL